jgi:hypothetical protein
VLQRIAADKGRRLRNARLRTTARRRRGTSALLQRSRHAAAAGNERRLRE